MFVQALHRLATLVVCAASLGCAACAPRRPEPRPAAQRTASAFPAWPVDSVLEAFRAARSNHRVAPESLAIRAITAGDRRYRAANEIKDLVGFAAAEALFAFADSVQSSQASRTLLAITAWEVGTRLGARADSTGDCALARAALAHLALTERFMPPSDPPPARGEGFARIRARRDSVQARCGPREQ